MARKMSHSCNNQSSNWVQMTSRLFAKSLLRTSLLSLSVTFVIAPLVSARIMEWGIPESMATVETVYTPGPQAKHVQYVLIQDIHSHPETQGKIAAVILYAHNHWGTRQVLVEGAFTEVGPPPYPIFKAERGQLSALELLQRGQLSGGELGAALVSNTHDQVPFKVIGVDDPQLYRRQLDVYNSLLEVQDEALVHLKKCQLFLSSEKNALLSRLLELHFSPQEYQRYLQDPLTVLPDPFLLHAVRLAEMYYRLSDERSHRFLQRAPAIASKGPCIIIVGGFHMPVLIRALRNQKKTFVVLKLHTTQPGTKVLYEERLTASYSDLHEIPPGHPYSPPMGSLRLSLAHRHDPA
jgi:hypothetical protein